MTAAGAPVPAATRARERVPAASGLADEDAAAQRAAVGQPGPPALPVRRVQRQERRDQRPPVVRDQRFHLHERQTVHLTPRLCNE